MITVILDSSNTKLLVALAKENALIEEISYEAWQQQSEYMIPELEKLLSKYNYTKDDISSIIVSRGPGSYTGVRIAITIAKVMALALNIPLYVLSSLHILANPERPSICLINARSGRSYIGVFNREKILLDDQIMTNEKVLQYIQEHPDYEVCGNVSYLGFSRNDDNIASHMLTFSQYIVPASDPLSVNPIYLKDEKHENA